MMLMVAEGEGLRATCWHLLLLGWELCLTCFCLDAVFDDIIVRARPHGLGWHWLFTLESACDVLLLEGEPRPLVTRYP